MKVLWITNIMMPPLAKAKALPVPAIGGWMYSSLKRLHAQNGIELAVATLYNGKKYDASCIDGIKYYLLPLDGGKTVEYNPGLEAYWHRVHDDFNPDVVHIHGSEYPHGLAYINACGPNGVVVSIQGLSLIHI